MASYRAMEMSDLEFVGNINHNLPERRQHMSNLEGKIIEVIGMIKNVDSKVDSISKNVEERLTDNRTMTEIQYQHIDALMEMHRADNLKAHADLLDAFKTHTAHMIERYEDREKVQNDRVSCTELAIKDLQERVEGLEFAPAKNALTAKEKFREWVKTGLIAAGSTAIITGFLVLIRWDDFIKLIKGGN